MFVVCNVNSYKEREHRIKAVKGNISNALHQFRKTGF